jgi:MFS family permease
VSHPYQLLFRTRSIRFAYVSVLLSAVPLGTITLGLVLSVESWTGSLSLAGSITALFTLGNAIGLTVQGRLIDHLGHRLVVLSAGLVCGLTLSMVALTGDRLRPRMVAALALLAGLAIPAITTAVRRSLPKLINDPTTRSAGYAVLSVMFQLAFAIGPLLVSLAVLVTSEASWALLVAAAMIIVASVVFAFTVPSQPPSVSAPESRVGLTALRPLLVLYAIAVLTGVVTGLMTVAIPAVTQAAGVVALAGVAFAASAIGDVTGAVAFGSRAWPLTERQQLSVALLAASCVAGVVFLASRSPWWMVLAIGVGGAIGAPIAIRLSSLLDDLALPETLGLAYGLLVSVGLVASAVGTSLAGHLGAWLEPRQLLLGPPLLLLASAIFTGLTRQPSTAH